MTITLPVLFNHASGAVKHPVVLKSLQVVLGCLAFGQWGGLGIVALAWMAYVLLFSHVTWDIPWLSLTLFYLLMTLWVGLGTVVNALFFPLTGLHGLIRGACYSLWTFPVFAVVWLFWVMLSSGSERPIHEVLGEYLVWPTLPLFLLIALGSVWLGCKNPLGKIVKASLRD